MTAGVSSRPLLPLAMRMLARDWRAGELRVIAAALIVAVAALTSVSAFTGRVERALAQQATHLLAADLALISDHPVPAAFVTEARRHGLATALTATFPSMVQSGAGAQLAELKAVQDAYPLRGALRIGAPAGTRETGHGPAPGRVWADRALVDRLALKPGDLVEVGEAQLRFEAVLTLEPDRALNFFALAPRLMLNWSDLPRTALLGVGSRVQYRLLLAGGRDPRELYRQWAGAHLERGMRLEDARHARPEVKNALDTGGRYLGLAAALSAALAAAAIALGTRRYAGRQFDACALLRCFGASRNGLLRLYLYQFLVLGTAAGVIGAALGYAVHYALAAILRASFAVDLPPPAVAPLVEGVAAGLLLLLGFGLPALMRVRDVPTLRVLRRELGASAPARSAYAAGALVFAAFLVWKGGDPKLGAYLVAGLAGVVLLAVAVSAALIRLSGRLPAQLPASLRFGMSSVRRRGASSVWQVAAFSLGMLALLLLTLVRADLFRSWQATLPPEAPNRFIINIQPEQAEAVRSYLHQAGLPTPLLLPMVRGRLTAINGRPVASGDYPEERARRLAEREFNLSWAGRLPAENRISAGQWWAEGEHGRPQFSVEEGIAQTLGIRLGDRLTYQIAGEELTGAVTSLRKLDWSSFRVNFFVIAAPGTLERYPASYITSFYLAPGDAGRLAGLVRAFPNLTVIDVEALLAQVRSVMDRLAQAIQFVFLFTLGSGVAVLYAAVGATLDERLREAALLKTLGARGRQIVLGLLAEFAVIGALSGIIAGGGASLLAWVLSRQVLHVPYAFDAWVWIIGIMGGAAGVAAAGWIAIRPVLRRSPMETLRAAAA